MAKEFSVSIVRDLSSLQSIRASLQGNVEEIISKAAHDMVGNIVNNFSPVSPSEPMHSPAVDTGTLKNSISADKDGEAYVVSDGVEYGVWLEYGTTTEDGGTRMAPRPFFLPAFEMTINSLPTGWLAKAIY